jgi:hypothetical protein
VEEAPLLTPLELGVLELERDWPVMLIRTRKRYLIRARLSISPTRYYALLAKLIDSEEAALVDPLTIHRLRRKRDERRRDAFYAEPPRQRRPR